MGLINNDLFFKCGAESGTFIHALWECSKILPLWEKVIDYLSKTLNRELPRSPRLCLLGDRTVVPLLDTILRCWKEPPSSHTKYVEDTDDVDCVMREDVGELKL